MTDVTIAKQVADAAAPEPGRLPLPRKVALASADYGFNLVYHTVELFLLFYFTDVLGLSPLYGGFVLTLGLLWDAFFDPVVGSMADRTRTRWGRFRPWVAGAAPVLALGMVATFHKPGLAGSDLAVYALVAHLLLRSAYTAGTVPFIAMSARVTRSSADRATIAGLRMQFAGLASLTVALGFGFAQDWAGDRATGFSSFSLVLGALIVAALWASMIAVREPPVEDGPPAPHLPWRSRAAADMAAFGRIVTRNGPFLRVLLAIILVSTAGTMIAKTTMYYYKYYVGAPELARYALATSAFSLLVAAPLWAALANWRSKREAWMLATLVAAAGLLTLFVVPPGRPWVSLAGLFVAGLGTTGHSVLFWAMIPDTVEVNEDRFGDRCEAKTLGLALFGRKLTLAVNAFWIGAVLSAVGYTPDVAQGAGALTAIKAFISVIPLACLLLSAVVIAGYRLDAATHARLVAEAERRRAAE